jgi:hypothetical protein
MPSLVVLRLAAESSTVPYQPSMVEAYRNLAAVLVFVVVVVAA